MFFRNVHVLNDKERLGMSQIWWPNVIHDPVSVLLLTGGKGRKNIGSTDKIEIWRVDEIKACTNVKFAKIDNFKAVYVWKCAYVWKYYIKKITKKNENIHILMKHLSVSGLRIIIYATYSLLIQGERYMGGGSKQKEHVQTVVDELGKRYTHIPRTILILVTFLVWNYKLQEKQRKESMACYFWFLFWSKTLFSNKFSRNRSSCHLLCYYVTCWVLGKC